MMDGDLLDLVDSLLDHAVKEKLAELEERLRAAPAEKPHPDGPGLWVGFQDYFYEHRSFLVFADEEGALRAHTDTDAVPVARLAAEVGLPRWYGPICDPKSRGSL